jgi:Leucine-rich repeat (LRR) protein
MIPLKTIRSRRSALLYIHALPIRFLYCLIFFFASQLHSAAQSRMADSLALVEFYDSTRGAFWSNNTNWLSATQPISNWNGIALDAQGRVSTIHLPSNNVEGILPNCLNNLTGLQNLRLWQNKLSGRVPTFNLPNLIDLSLQDNQLTGNVPTFNLPELVGLRLYLNQLTGPIPPLNSTKLEDINFADNQMTGSIPDYNLPFLRIIHLYNNKFTGSIPSFSGTQMQYLLLDRNLLTGSLPNFNLPLKWLNVASNRLTGAVPNLNIPSLELLYMGNNQLTGSIPASFQTLTNLQELSFYKNQIDSVPNLSMLTNLNPTLSPVWFKADTNKLTFDDILPNILRGLTYMKQDSIFRDTTYSKLTGQSLVINLGIDGALTTNVYKWYKDGTLFRTTSVNQLTFNSLVLDDAGLYTCEVTNPGAPALTLYSRKMTIQVGCSPPRDTAITALLCTNSQTVTLPSGRTVNTIGTYLDTVRSVLSPSCDSVRATVTVNTDYHCRDSLALLVFYANTNGQNWLNNRNWLTATRLEDWQGIDLDAQGRVYSISLASDSLRGNLSNVLDTLTHLELLDLADNRLTGNIPNWNLPALRNLYLDLNRFDGNLPTFNLPVCQSVYLDNNLLTGKIPVFNTPVLKRLRFSSNRIDSLPDLTRFALQECAAQGNLLTFDDILPNLAYPIQYLGQDSIFKDTTYLLNAGNSLTIALGIDAGIPNNDYKWFKNGAFYRNTSTNQLIINALTATDAGIYTCEVSNPSASNLKLLSRKATVKVNCPAISRNVNASFCQGHFYTLPSGRITTVGGTFRDTVKSWLRCDSVINTTVTMLPTQINRLPIEYDCAIPQNRMDTTLLMNRNGCDSIVIRTRIAARHVTELPLKYRCNPSDTATQTRRLSNQYGCDSIVNQRFALAPSVNRTVHKWVCSPAEVGSRITRDTTFLGCDSIVTTHSALARKDSLNFVIIECNIRDTGIIRKALTNRFGCDSIVIERHRLVKTDTVIQTNVVCDTLLERIDTTILKNRQNCDSLLVKHYVFDHCVCLKQNNIYNGLIPNDNDAQNDFFNIQFVERYLPNTLVITDKRGMVVYRTQNYLNHWTGTYQNGEPLPSGVYDYVFRTRHPITQKECLRIGTLTITYIP